MALIKQDVKEARLHMLDVKEIGEAMFEARPNEPNVGLVFSKEDLEKLELLIHAAEEWDEMREWLKESGTLDLQDKIVYLENVIANLKGGA